LKSQPAEEIMAAKQKRGLTFAVFRLPGLALPKRVETIAVFEGWEHDNLGAAKTSDGRLTDEINNSGRLAAISERNEPSASSRPGEMASTDKGLALIATR
jgi:hypothetical protein